jgi:HPt (histidine-containing phosphotransfer) domain-containing protein
MANDAAPLDPERLTMLQDLDSDGSLLSALADEYGRDAEQQLGVIREAINVGDASALERAAHTLKGASANLGAVAVAEQCRELEMKGRAAALDGAGDLAASIASEIPRVNAALARVASGA